MGTDFLTIAEVEQIAYQLAQETMEFDEHIPAFSTRFPNRLESCINVPFQTFGDKDMYSTLIQKAAILFYVMIKNYPFQNGNKRIAVTTLLVFLLMNHKWLSVNPHDLYEFAEWVAKSDRELKRGVVHTVEDFLKKYLTSPD